MIPEIVVNLHVVERCNYACGFCFGRWQAKGQDAGVFSGPAGHTLIHELMRYFRCVDDRDYTVRFNFVGGEPALLHDLPSLVATCRGLGARTSFVTNGLMFRRFDADWISENFDMAGLSVDSASPATNLAIGRANRSGEVLDLRRVCDQIEAVREHTVVIKINTVVSAWNWREDMSDLIRRIKPDRWKIFRVLPIYDNALSVTEYQYESFLSRHAVFARIIAPEDNDAMAGSYIMVDPFARFFWWDEMAGAGYRYSDPIPDVGIAKAFRQCGFDWTKFFARYEFPSWRYPLTATSAASGG